MFKENRTPVRFEWNLYIHQILDSWCGVICILAVLWVLHFTGLNLGSWGFLAVVISVYAAFSVLTPKSKKERLNTYIEGIMVSGDRVLLLKSFAAFSLLTGILCLGLPLALLLNFRPPEYQSWWKDLDFITRLHLFGETLWMWICGGVIFGTSIWSVCYAEINKKLWMRIVFWVSIALFLYWFVMKCM